jgi:hypothetical protein
VPVGGKPWICPLCPIFLKNKLKKVKRKGKAIPVTGCEGP